MNVIQFLFLISFFSSLLFGDLLKPYNNQIISYTHILFEWEQQPNATEYQMQLSDTDSFENNPNLLLNIQTPKLIHIYKNDINWNDTYFWRVRDIYEDGSYGSWTLPFSFTISEKKYEVNSGYLSIDLIDESLVDEQLILLGDLSGGLFLTSFIFDKNGKEIWNADIMVNHINRNGQLFGFSYDNFPSQTGVKINYDNNILWKGPNDVYIDIHEVKSIPNGNYMGFEWEYQTGPIPIGDWTDYFNLLGYEADGLTNEFPWFGQAIIEWDENSNEIWRWSPFDYFTMSDYDAYGGTWWNAAFNDVQGYDWMHSNAFDFDEQESAIYVSSRHLSRITKIDYPSGEVIWNIGLPNNFEGSVSEHICTDLGITWQHNVQFLENGNILLFDNGNLSQLFGSEAPTTRALEFKVINNSYCEIVWEYTLPDYLYGPWMGSVQKLDNSNYFINTVGSGGHAIEVDQNQNIILDAHYLLVEDSDDFAGNYRSYKIPSIHPNAYSVIFQDYKKENEDSGIYFSDNINILISNESAYTQHYDYHLFDSEGWFNEELNSIIIEPYSSIELNFNPSNINSTISNLTFNIIPIYHNYDSKNYNFNIFSPQMTGDLNSDGILNILDIIILVGIILNDSEFTFASDINGDDIVNILDVIMLLNLILE